VDPGILRQVEAADLFASLVRNRQHELRFSGGRLRDAVREDRAMGRIRRRRIAPRRSDLSEDVEEGTRSRSG